MALIIILVLLIEPDFLMLDFNFATTMMTALIVCFVTTCANGIFVFWKNKEENKKLKVIKDTSIALFIVSFICLMIFCYML